MKLGETIYRSYNIYRDVINGSEAYKVEEEKENQARSARVLVRMDPDSGRWMIVNNLDKEVSHQDLRNWFGLWKKGNMKLNKLCFWKKGEKQNNVDAEEINPGEVQTFKDIFDGKKYEGSEILTTDGAGIPKRQLFYYSNVIDSKLKVDRTHEGPKITLDQTSLVFRRGMFNPW